MILMMALALQATIGNSTTPARDRRWVPVSISPERTVYVDSIRSRRIDDTTVDIWHSVEFQTTQVIDDIEYQRLMVFERVNCKGIQYKVTVAMFYSMGRLVKEIKGEWSPDWEEAAPGSMMENLIVRGCLMFRLDKN